MITDWKDILVTTEPPVGFIKLNRPEALNALSPNLVKEVSLALGELDEDPEVRVVVITGGEKVFAAGADIKRMADSGPFDPMHAERWKHTRRIKDFSKPLIAAVSGFALGGGLELAMSADIVIASETARFGQPEINLGIIPGGGGTQRLTRILGKHRSMEIILSGKIFSAKDAHEWGLVNTVVPVESLLPEAKRIAAVIAGFPAEATKLAKESILNSANSGLSNGARAEALAFELLLSTEECKERMKAFSEKGSTV